MSRRHKHHCCEKKCYCEGYKNDCFSPIFSCFGGSGYGTGTGSGLGIIIILIIILCLCKGRW